MRNWWLLSTQNFQAMGALGKHELMKFKVLPSSLGEELTYMK